LKIPAPPLLPATIATLAVLLTLKSGLLVQSIAMHGGRTDAAVVTVANAASTERAAEPGAEHAPQRTPERSKERPPEHGKPAAAAEQKPPEAAPIPDGPPPVSETERALLQDLRQRRKELDTRAEAVTARESLLAATEQKLAARVGELQLLQKKLEGLDAAQKQKEDAGWQGLVKLYEAMKPRDAATIFNDLQMPVLLQVLDRMKDAKAAAVMAVMSTDKARDVTAELARMRTGKDAAQLTPPAARPNPAGG
jgi:flagellar motility protein MotE (MotC chaperone)